MDLDRLRNWVIPAVDDDYTVKDGILYALGLGFGSDPMDENELGFVFEDGLKIVPSICNTLSHPGFWVKEPVLGLDWVKILHGEQSFVMHHPLPAEGKVKGTYRILSVEDKGKEKGAVLTLEKRLVDRENGTLYYTVVTTVFMRGDGGQGGFGEIPVAPDPLPERAPDTVVDIATFPQIALVYRLSGDYNPIHASPSIARKAGFDRPILHGLCTMGLATRAILRARCDYDPARLTSMFVRFSRPVYPGETIRTEIFDEGGGLVRFRCRATERDVIVLDRGSATVD
ncbi:3-alpha,7-alpha,12-alpha-trihydroxy-5-beta-cholest-24-enoyl-CoA hydratase [Sphingobium sp. 22B]|uniref:MaoC/PaaZ C-terminal domain-containing protein n=1 Tax=unclassified Sphingobium TaxID=2611147 RepID=UPI0007850D66|nr:MULTISPECIES: MaoC/PaaZ C-terminal domain-containing protein [unclassified Sphingobium]KXU33821.1 3-alpha,7-alpha,12-alpha-trihydroxy-5-beta-cholest-24-enoyl-CoA hydratase [Sphingobium sp. AM]KYC33765.1 3-alpha,7-alpha,12-alpha-trihydroxy-5-beta-cholest-24-enoyl-CoA hydratase [Sphingobium sp. 22B]OAP33503.1 3-alpha,7-alpha,12-alpha-trihydroxy-5-beta-cholest-24-enoyl-CoA hydratase [Sphingobium sp. 20006FA]